MGLGVGLIRTATEDNFVFGYCIPKNQDIKTKDMDTNHDNLASASLLTRPQHVSPFSGKTPAWPADSTTSVFLPFRVN